MRATHDFHPDKEGLPFIEIPELKISGRARSVSGLTPKDLSIVNEATNEEKLAFAPRFLLVLAVSAAPWIGALGVFRFVFD